MSRSPCPPCTTHLDAESLRSSDPHPPPTPLSKAPGRAASNCKDAPQGTEALAPLQGMPPVRAPSSLGCPPPHLLPAALEGPGGSAAPSPGALQGPWPRRAERVKPVPGCVCRGGPRVEREAGRAAARLPLSQCLCCSYVCPFPSTSYQRAFDDFLERCRQLRNYRANVIANINNCLPFR